MDEHVTGSSSVSVVTSVVAGVPATRVVGEIDAANVDMVQAEVSTQVDQAASALVVDLTRVTFFASSGLAMLLYTQRKATARGVGFAVVAHHRAVLRPLEVTGLTDLLAICPTVEQAHAGVGRIEPTSSNESS